MPFAPDLTGAALDGRYELQEAIGEGAFGRVYRGHDRRLQRTVAIKLIKPWWAEDPAWARSFEREARLLARVSHPGIVQIFDVGQADEGLYYVSELVDGESLAERLERGPLAPWEAASVAEQFARALGRAHARQVVHRDVKPANILVAHDGRVKVGDFGVARLAEGSSDGAGATIVGTPRYMAPEQARGLGVSPATDVYSAGIVLYEMLAGAAPFSDGPAVELALHHLRDEPPPLPATVPAPLRQIVQRALAKEPAERYASGGELAEALAGARQNPLPAPTLRAPKYSPRRNLNPAGRRRSLMALGAVFLLMAAMIVAALLLSGGGLVRVPRLTGLHRGQVLAQTRRLALEPTFRHRYSSAPRGTVITQRPRARKSVTQGTEIQVVLSAGAPPVKLPDLGGESVGQAESSLSALGLHARVVTTIAPRIPAGAVYSQSPAPGASLQPPGRVTLNVAETPRWRSVTWLGGSAHSTSSAFTIRGTRWRVVYTLDYVGTCEFVLFCNGPSTGISRPDTGQQVGGFGLQDGGRQTQVLRTGPGEYRLTISPGSDTSRWSAYVEDYY
jgi:serine/threonine-protein kinase